jgi:hypothetical protein
MSTKLATAETKTKAPSIKNARADVERGLLYRIQCATEVTQAQEWLTLYERFQVCTSGAVESLPGTMANVNGQQAALPGITE